MIHITLPVDDYTFIRNYFDDLDSYQVGLNYSQDSVTFDIQNEKVNDFVADYHASVMRHGLKDEASFDDVGVRMNQIHLLYFEPAFEDNE